MRQPSAPASQAGGLRKPRALSFASVAAERYALSAYALTWIAALTRAREARADSSELRPHCQCCRFSDLLSMTPYLAAPPRRLEPVARRGRCRHHRSPELHRPPESANNNSAKQKWRRQPAAGSACRRTRLARV
jgi:hypothetical protein